MDEQFSVIIPFGGAIDDWQALLARFETLRPQLRELIVVLDGFEQDPPADAPAFLSVVSTPARNGPAGARNLGARIASSEMLAFTDDDCEPDPDWLHAIHERFSADNDAVVGGVRILPAGWLGDAISMLGFPAGGNLGFTQMWEVQPDGTTDHLSACNFSIRREVYQRLGGFDETFPFPGGEDNEFAFRLHAMGSRIKYTPAARITHPARTGYRELIAWQFRRGRGQYYLLQRVGRTKPYVRSRFRSAIRSLAGTWGQPYFLLMPFLIATTFIAQASGYFIERHWPHEKPAPGLTSADAPRHSSGETE